MAPNSISLKRIQSHTESLAQILRPGGLQVPKFQRDYSWKQEQWEELWSDVMYSTEIPGSPDEHYMGYIVLRESQGSGAFDIIDGQQRLSTLSILLLAAIGLVRNSDDPARADLLFDQYIGERDPMTLDVDNKLTLNSNNKKLYEQLSNDKKPQMKSLNVSNKLLFKAFEYFQQKINEEHKGDVGATVQFALDVANGMHLTRIELLRDMNIYKIFQTLNATGKQLSINDLLKNYLFLAIDRANKLTDEQATELHNKWTKIEDSVKDRNLAKFISVEWNRRNDFCRTKELFRDINSNLQSPQEIYEYLGILQDSGKLYAELLKGPANQFWNSQHRNVSRELKECLECLGRLSIKSPHGLLLSALEKVQDAATLNKILRVIRIISMRYNCICQKQANRQEKLYSEMANDVFHGSFAFDEQTKKKFQELYPSDIEFASEFAKIEMDNSNKAKYILRAIERNLDPNSTVGIDEVQLEHILPQNPVPQWKKVFPEYENYVSRLGNMTIVSEKLNNEASNKPFEEKKRILSFDKQGKPVSRTKLTEHVCSEYSVWDASAIDKFQEFLAEQALEVWSIDWNRL